MAVELRAPSLKKARARTITVLASWWSLRQKRTATTGAPLLCCLLTMYILMLMTAYQLQVLLTVVIAFAIDMMNDLAWLKRTAKVLTHYQDVFRDVAVLPGIWVFRLFNQDIAAPSFSAAPFPARVCFAFPASFWSAHDGSLTLIRGYVK